MSLATPPDPPYYAVIFTAQRREGDDGYQAMAAKMEALAATMPGYLGLESARGEDGFGVTVSYWASEEAIRNWKRQAEHLEAQQKGRALWYENYEVRVAKVERAYGKTKETK